MPPKATTKTAKQPKAPKATKAGAAGPSKVKGKGKKRQVSTDESDTDGNDEVNEVEVALNAQLKALGLARVDFTEMKTVVNDLTAAKDDIGEQVAAAIWSYNIIDLDNEKTDVIKFVNPWNSRPVDISKGQALKNSMIEQGRRPFLPANHIYIIENTDRFDLSCRHTTAGELWKAPMLRLKAGDTAPVKIPGGGHRCWAVNRLLAQSRILRLQTLPLGISKATQRLEQAGNEDEMKTIQGEIASMKADLTKVEAEEVALGHWGVTVLDEKLVTPELARKLARNVQDYQYVEQEQEIIVNLLAELNLIKRTKGDPRASQNISKKLKKYPGLDTAFMTTQSFNFLNDLGGTKSNEEEELGAITNLYLRTAKIGSVKFIERAFASDIAGIVITAAKAMHDLIFQVLTTGDIASNDDYDAMLSAGLRWSNGTLPEGERQIVEMKARQMHGDMLGLIPKGDFITGMSLELLELIDRVNADLILEDSLPFALLDTDAQNRMNLYATDIEAVFVPYFEGKTPALNGEDHWNLQKKKMHRKLSFMTTELPTLPHCPLPMLAPNTFVKLVDILDEITPALLEWISWISPLSLYQECVSQRDEVWTRHHGAFNRLIDEIVDPKSMFTKQPRAKTEYAFAMFIMNNITSFYEFYTDIITHAKDIGRPRGHSARWGQDSFRNRWIKRLQLSAPDTPDYKEINAVLLAQKHCKLPSASVISRFWPLSTTWKLDCGWWTSLKSGKNFDRDSHKTALQTYVEMGLVHEYRRPLLEKSEVGRQLRQETRQFLLDLIPPTDISWKFPDGLTLITEARANLPSAKSLVAQNRRHRAYVEDEKKLAAVINKLYNLDIVKVTRTDKHVQPAILRKVEELCETIRQNYEVILSFEHEESLRDPNNPLSFSEWTPPSTTPFPVQPFSVKKPLTWQFENDAPPVERDAEKDTQTNTQGKNMDIDDEDQGGRTPPQPKEPADVRMSPTPSPPPPPTWSPPSPPPPPPLPPPPTIIDQSDPAPAEQPMDIDIIANPESVAPGPPSQMVSPPVNQRQAASRSSSPIPTQPLSQNDPASWPPFPVDEIGQRPRTPSPSSVAGGSSTGLRSPFTQTDPTGPFVQLNAPSKRDADESPDCSPTAKPVPKKKATRGLKPPAPPTTTMNLRHRGAISKAAAPISETLTPEDEANLEAMESAYSA